MADHHQPNGVSGNLEEEIESVFEKICQAFAASDIELVLRYFADDERLTKVSNGHVLRGKKELAAYWRQHISDDGGPKITVANIEINPIDARHVWTIADEFISIGNRSYRAIVTNLFVLKDSGWKILLDHTTPVES